MVFTLLSDILEFKYYDVKLTILKFYNIVHTFYVMGCGGGT